MHAAREHCEYLIGPMPSTSGRHPPSRKGSAESIGIRGERRHRDRRELRDVLVEEEENTAPKRDSLPPYEELEYIQARPLVKDRQARLETAVAIVIVTPLLAALVLLYLITSSSDSLRPKFCVIKVALPSNELDSLFQSATVLTQDTSATTGNATSELPVNAFRRDDSVSGSGYLSLGLWGWCLKSNDVQQYIIPLLEQIAF